MILTINGKPGSGKSSVARIIADRLGLEYIDIGEIRRKAAKEKAMTLEEYNKWGETTDATDKPVDDMLLKFAAERDQLVISSRTAYHFIPKSIKILLDVDLWVAAQRIFSDEKLKTRNETANTSSVEQIEHALKERMRSDAARYEKYYHLDIYDPSAYDLVIDTSNISIEATYQKIADYLKSKDVIPKT